MNIFLTDACPKTSAQNLCDKHVVKMIVESCQMLTNAYTLIELENLPKTQTGKIRRYSYMHHPCSKWVIYSNSNWQWVLEHTIELTKEYTKRFNKTHFCTHLINYFNEQHPIIPNKGFTNPAQAMPDEFKRFYYIDAYREYYKHKRTVIDMKWTNSTPPDWMHTCS